MDPCLDALKTIITNFQNGQLRLYDDSPANSVIIVSRYSIPKFIVAEKSLPIGIRLAIKVTDPIVGIEDTAKKYHKQTHIYRTLSEICSNNDLLLIESLQRAFFIGVTFPCSNYEEDYLRSVFHQYRSHLESVYDSAESKLLDLRQQVKEWVKELEKE